MTNLTEKDTLFSEIKSLLTQARTHIVKAVNTTMVITYFEIGRIIVEHEQKGKERAEYGKQVLKELSKKLTDEFGKGFSVENLDRMRFFYQIYSKSISSTPLTISSEIIPNNQMNYKFTLSWSHYIKLMRITNPTERQFYETEATQNNWSLRELERQFDSALYERIVLSQDKKGVLADNLKKYHSPQNPEDVVKDPYIEHLNYYDRFIKTEDENPTIGIILSKDKKESLVEITLPKDSNIFASQYKLYLPTKEKFKAQLKNFEIN